MRYSFGKFWTEWHKPAAAMFEIVACSGDQSAVVYSK